jgi:hypothetical protein
MLVNSLNIPRYHFSRLNQGPKVQIYKFWGLICPIKWVLGVFTVIPMWGSIHPGRSAQGPINHALPATWALAERFNNALGEISQQQETCGWIIFWVQFWDIAQVPIIGRKISQIKLWAKYGIRKFETYFSYIWLPTWKPCKEIWRFFFQFGWILAIQNLKKHLILAVFRFMT